MILNYHQFLIVIALPLFCHNSFFLNYSRRKHAPNALQVQVMPCASCDVCRLLFPRPGHSSLVSLSFCCRSNQRLFTLLVLPEHPLHSLVDSLFSFVCSEFNGCSFTSGGTCSSTAILFVSGWEPPQRVSFVMSCLLLGCFFFFQYRSYSAM